VSLRLRRDVACAERFFSETLVECIADVFHLFLSAVVLATLDWKTLLLTVALFCVFLIPGQHIRQQLLDQHRRTNKHTSSVGQVFHETLQKDGAMVTRVLGAQATNIQRFEGARQRLDASKSAAGALRGLLWCLRSGFWRLAIVLTYWIGGYVHACCALSVGNKLQLFTCTLRMLALRVAGCWLLVGLRCLTIVLTVSPASWLSTGRQPLELWCKQPRCSSMPFPLSAAYLHCLHPFKRLNSAFAVFLRSSTSTQRW